MLYRSAALLTLMALRPAFAENAGPGPWLDASEGPTGPVEKSTLSTSERALAITAAVVPGFIARGIGSYVAEKPRVAKRLAITGAIGLGAMVIGGLPVGLTAGNPYTVVPGVPLVVAGAGLFMGTWFSDIWVAAGGDRVHSTARAPTPWSLELGTTFVSDPLRDRSLVRAMGRYVLGRVELGAGGYVDVGGNEIAGLLETRVRILGAPSTGAPIADGTRLELRAAVRGRNDDDDRLSVFTGEAEAILRVDFRRLARELDATFVELSSGLGFDYVRYRADVTDLGSLLLGRFAWGLYLGRRGETTVFYDHRRDLLAGGIPAGRAAGFVGSIGANLDLRLFGHWAARAELEYGSAYVGALSLRYQGGPP
jgi:hypothetical protein